MFRIYKLVNLTKVTVATHETFDLCKAAVEATGVVAYFEADKDYPGCADFITDYGEIYGIEPEGFKLPA